MKKVRYAVYVLLVLMLCLPLAGWAAQEPGSPGAQKAPDAREGQDVGGVQEKGEAKEAGKETPKEEAKEEECPATFGPIITDTAVPIDTGHFAVQPTFGLSFITNTLTRNWRRVSAGGNFKSFGMDWKFTYGPIKNMEVFVDIPFINNWGGAVDEPGPNGERYASFAGLGDINLTMKYQLLEEGPKNPTVTALFATEFPSGHFLHINPGRLGTDELGGGAYAFTTGLNLSKCLKPFVVYANIWYTMQTAYTSREDRPFIFMDFFGNMVESEPVPTNLRNYPRDVVTLNLAAEYIITEKWIALLELTSSWDGGRLFGHQANLPPGALVSILPGIEYMVSDNLGFALGVNFDLIGKNTDAAITPLFSAMYQF
jgi:hypothetical protein